jgi:D-beta-D-heptose 7-phosphate kinase/D-beta-D-heptose 1-phosphate adenosyltransferase
MDIFQEFSKVKVLVVGDVMLDRYLWGEVTRISPEAPVPVVSLKKTDLIAGGAANVAANIAGLGARAYLVGVVGNDAEGNLLPGVLADSGVSGEHLIKINDRPTTVKTRIVAHNQQIARIDQETTIGLTEREIERIWRKIYKLLNEVSVVLVSDYNKGLVSEKLILRLIKKAKLKGKLILIDPKGKDYSKYSGATMVTPNKFEVAQVCGLDGDFEQRIEWAGLSLLSKLNLKALLITRGENGMTLFETDKSPLTLKTLARHVYDVTGAGDTVIATVAVMLGAGADFSQAAEIANAAAGLVVEEIGTTVIKIEQLKKIYA